MLVAGDFPLNSTAQERGASVRDSTPMRWPEAPAFRAWRARALPVKLGSGGVGEWLNAAVLKTVRLERVSGVRIPPPPPALLVTSPRLLRPPLLIRLSLGQAGVIAGTHPCPVRPTLELSLKCLPPAESSGWLGLGVSSWSSTPRCHCHSSAARSRSPHSVMSCSALCHSWPMPACS